MLIGSISGLSTKGNLLKILLVAISLCSPFRLPALDGLPEVVGFVGGQEGQAGDAVVGLEGVEQVVRRFVDHLVVQLLVEDHLSVVDIEHLKSIPKIFFALMSSLI